MNRRNTAFVRVASGVLHLLLLLGCGGVLASQLLAAGIRVTEMPAGNLNFMLSGRVSCSFYFPGPNGNSVIQGLASEYQIESELNERGFVRRLDIRLCQRASSSMFLRRYPLTVVIRFDGA